MRKMLLVSMVVALALVGADPALAQDPCEPSCELDLSDGDGPIDLAGTAPVFLAMIALLVAPRKAEGEDRT